MRTTSLLAFLATALAASCQGKPQANQQATQDTAALTTQSSGRSAAEVAHRGSACTQSAAAMCACESGSSTVGSATDPSGTASSQGVRAVGRALGDARRVTVGELLAKPRDYVGQTVRVEGEVTAMCHHRRAWFAVKDGAQRPGEYVRVQTTPAFLVPAGAIGKRAKAEGRVELVQVPAATAEHYAADHRLGDPKAVTGPVEAPVIIATGAEFN